MSESGSGSRQRTIVLTKLEDPTHYRLWRVATEATFDVYNVLNIVLGTEPKPIPPEDDSSELSEAIIADEIIDWEQRHKLAREALYSALKPAQLIRVAHLQSAHEIWQRLADEYGRISELKLAQLHTKLRSLRKSSSLSMQAHVDEFERIQKEIEFHSESLKPQDINIAFLLSLGDSETWKNFRNSNLHRAVKLKPSDLFAEVILIDEANVSTSTSSQPESAKALTTSFNSGGKGKQNKWKRDVSFHVGEQCEGCQMPGHVVENCPKKCRFCFERGHVFDDCLKRRWVDEQRFSKRSEGEGNESRKRKRYSPSFEHPFKHSVGESYPSSKNNLK